MRMLFALVLALLGGLACAAPIRLGERTVVVPMGKAGAVVPVDMTTAGGPAPARTTATVRWSASGLTVAFACTDDDVVRNLRPRDDPDMWMDDCVEIFLDPGHTHDDMSRWVHVLVNAAGSIHDERGPTIGYKGAGTSLGGDTAFNLPGLTAAAAKTTDGWSAEIFIPWKDLGGPPKAGDAWGFNLCREDYPGDRYL